MKVYLVLLLLLVPLATAHSDPFAHFISDGEIISPIVLGDDAPVSDVQQGADIIAYIQQSASEAPPVGLAKFASEVDIHDGGRYILLGTPQTNPLIAEVLDLAPGDALNGPFIAEFGDWFIISGSSAQDIQVAVASFRANNRRMGAITKAEVDEDDEQLVEQGAIAVPEPEPQQEPQEEPKPVQEVVKEVVQETQPKKNREESCDERLFCTDNVLMKQNADCSTDSLDWCAHGCEDGVCKQGIFKKLFSTLFGWMPFVK